MGVWGDEIDLPRLQTLDFGANAFRDCVQVQFEGVAWELRGRIDLPELITIQMDWNTFRFSVESSATSLVMRSLNVCEE